MDNRRTVGQRTEQQCAMRNRLVARDANSPADLPDRLGEHSLWPAVLLCRLLIIHRVQVT
jgi:hypothetical protein